MRLTFSPLVSLRKGSRYAGAFAAKSLRCWWTVPATVVLVLVLLIFAAARQEREDVAAGSPLAATLLLSSPLTFEENAGQNDPAVRYLVRGPGYSLFLTAAGSTLVSNAYPDAPLSMTLVGGDSAAAARGVDRLRAERHYFIGADPARWRPHVPTYTQVRYDGVYPGIDLLYYGHEGQLEYDFVVAPGADSDTVRLRFDGAQRAELDAHGDLLLTTAGGIVVHHAPRVYQDTPQGRRPVAAHYQLHKRGAAQAVEVGFVLAAYDTSLPLIIDPALTYASFLGGVGSDEGRAVTVDGAGNFYVTGMTKSPAFPGDNGLYPPHVNPTLVNASDAFVSKFDKDGTLLFTAYLGAAGSYGDAGNAIAVDAAGKIYLTGSTDNSSTTGFPTTTGAYDHVQGGTGEVFVTVLKADGSGLEYSAVLGSGFGDAGEGIAVDAAGDIYVAGWAVYDPPPYNFPTTAGAYQTGYGGGAGDYDAFVLKLHPAGAGDSDLVYSTLLGGAADDRAYGIAVDGSGRAFVTGRTASSLTAVGALSGGGSLHGGQDAFVARLSADGSTMEFLTYLGGDGIDTGRAIALDAAGDIFVAGRTYSSDLFNGSLAGDSDAFAARISGGTLSYATRLGGGADDEARAVAVDSAGRAYVAGWTTSADFPSGGGLTGHQGLSGPDGFVAVLAADGARSASDYLGGNGADGARGVAVDSAGQNIYVTGWTNSTSGFPYTQNAAQTGHAGGTNSDCGENLNYGGCDAFVARFGPLADLAVTIEDNGVVNLSGPSGTAALAYRVTVSNNGPDAASNVVLTNTLPPAADLTYVANDAGCDATGLPTVTCALGTLAAGASRTVTLNATLISANQVTFEAAVAAAEADYPTDNNTAQEFTQAGTELADPVPAGGTDAPFIVITDPPSGTGVTPAGGGGGGALGWVLFALSALYRLIRRHR